MKHLNMTFFFFSGAYLSIVELKAVFRELCLMENLEKNYKTPKQTNMDGFK